MKLTLISLILTVFGLYSTAQVKIPRHEFDSETKKFNFKTTIKNISSEPLAFYVQPNNPNFKNAFRNDSTLIAYLLEDIDLKGEKEDIQIQLIKKAGHLFKSIYFINNQSLFDEGNNEKLYALKYSLMGMFWGQHSKGAKDFFKGFVELLLHTDYFIQTDFREITNHYHNFGEVLVTDNWMLVDVDPKKPAFINEYKISPNGYASYKDIINDTSLIQPYHHYPWWDKKNTTELKTDHILKYKRQMSKDSLSVVSPYIQLSKGTKLSGKFVLCSGCEIKWEQKGYFIDLQEPKSKAFYDSMLSIKNQITQLELANQILENKFNVFLEKFVLLINDFFPDQTMELKFHQFLNFIQKELYVLSEHRFYIIGYEKLPLHTISMSIPDKFMNAGDLQAPLFVTYCSSEKEVNFNNQTFKGKNSFNAWVTNNIDSNSTNNDEVFYLQNVSSNSRTEIVCPFNPSMLPFALGFELKLENPERAKDLKIDIKSN